MKLALITIGLIALAFAGLAVKLWCTKKGKFVGTCAGQNPYINKEEQTCGCRGKLPKAQACQKNTVAELS